MSKAGWLEVDPEIVYVDPVVELEDRNTGMRATGETYVDARDQLREYVGEYDDYDEWLDHHGSMGDKLCRSMDAVADLMTTMAEGSY